MVLIEACKFWKFGMLSTYYLTSFLALSLHNSSEKCQLHSHTFSFIATCGIGVNLANSVITFGWSWHFLSTKSAIKIWISLVDFLIAPILRHLTKRRSLLAKENDAQNVSYFYEALLSNKVMESLVISMPADEKSKLFQVQR